jgi:SAM-dependent methyltransferase
MLLPVKEFYDNLCFPGEYSIKDLQSYGSNIKNHYLEFINREIVDGMRILDAGCGTGLIANLFALRNKKSFITGLDFSNAIHYADKFSKINNIDNTNFINTDIADYNTDEQFDLIICQGVLHHVPDCEKVINNLLKNLKNNGKMILGLYHPFGRIAKKFIQIDYQSDILYKDQELNPYSQSFTVNDVKKMIPGWKIIHATPTIMNSVALASLFNYRNGGLVTYLIKKND